MEEYKSSRLDMTNKVRIRIRSNVNTSKWRHHDDHAMCLYVFILVCV